MITTALTCLLVQVFWYFVGAEFADGVPNPASGLTTIDLTTTRYVDYTKYKIQRKKVFKLTPMQWLLPSPMSLMNPVQHYQYHGAVPPYPGTPQVFTKLTSIAWSWIFSSQPAEPFTGGVSVKAFPRSGWSSSRQAAQPGLDLVCTSPWRGNHVLLQS